MLGYFRFRRRPVLARLRSGPLGPHLDGFAAWLRARGYACRSARPKIQVVAGLSGWLDRRHLGIADLSEDTARGFLRHRRRMRAGREDRAALRDLLRYLRTTNLLPAAKPEDRPGEREAIELSFTKYLTQERGLSHLTCVNYLPAVRQLLTERFRAGPFNLQELCARDVTGFVLRHARTLSNGRAKVMVPALRSFFRFLRLRGEIATDLAACVPTVANWRLSTLPKALDSADVQRLLRTCDKRQRNGRRDRAVLLLLARLGLRAGEIIQLKLDDLDWQRGELLVRGKGSRLDRLPMPREVGIALVEYLRRDRPRCDARQVFVRARAPIQGLANSSCVSTIVRRALERAGIRSPRKGAHVLRHSLAAQMLRRGASLTEIGQILRHRHPNTTEIYAKIDVGTLGHLARPWPGGGR